MFYVFCVYSSFAIILIGKRELFTLLCLSSWCIVSVVLLFLASPQVCLKCVIVVFPSQTPILCINIFLFLIALYIYVCVNQIKLWRLIQ